MPSRAFSREEVIDAEFVIGDEEAREKVCRFIDGLSEKEIEGDVTILLKPLGIGETSTLQDWTFTPGEDPNPMADAIVDRACEEGDVLGGTRKFQVTLEGHKSRCSFSLQFKEKDDDEIDELPNGKGIISQQMRHTEKMAKMLITVVAETAKATRQREHEQNQRIKDLEKVHLEGVKTYAEILDAKQVRDLEMAKLVKSEERKDQIGGMLMQSIPSVVNKFLGNRTLGGPSPLENMLEGFFRTFDPQQIQDLMSTGSLKFKPEQMMGLMEMFKAVHDRATAGKQESQPGTSQAAE